MLTRRWLGGLALAATALLGVTTGIGLVRTDLLSTRTAAVLGVVTVATLLVLAVGARDSLDRTEYW